ncbi:MAG: 4Fe-4S dicluster domain-containing protein [Deltaproteobacteria bacterium]|nr:4Fe-4S dicluster domain-containing protein [Deltaproteobacteria bacterium]
MIEEQTVPVDTTLIKELLEKNKGKMKLSLSVCAHCSLCAESCFLFNAHNNDPKYMPSYKFIHSIGKVYKKKGKVDRAELKEISVNIWERCVLCTRCYCPFGIDIPSMIALARKICRSQGVFPRYD